MKCRNWNDKTTVDSYICISGGTLWFGAVWVQVVIGENMKYSLHLCCGMECTFTFWRLFSSQVLAGQAELPGRYQ